MEPVEELHSPSIMELDIFALMLNLRFSLPTLHDPEEEAHSSLYQAHHLDQLVLRMGVIAYLVQVLLCSPEVFDEEGKNLRYILLTGVPI